jgi:hypothetical protein
MTTSLFAPPTVPLDQAAALLRSQGFAVLDSAATAQLAGHEVALLDALRADWAALEPDEYLLDGGRYRRRRHASCVLHPAMAGAAMQVQAMPHRAHWQPVTYNALHGGLQRWFAPVADATLAHAAWQGLLLGVARIANDLRGAQPWWCEAHQFRIDTTGGIGRPTPEGAHRDGVDLVAVILVDRHGIKGGETRVFDAAGPAGQRFTLSQPWQMLLLDDARVIHESTPIQPEGDGPGWRDTLVLTLRSGGFQDAPAA